MSNLIFFTTSFPYGLGEMWKANELSIFAKHFEAVTVVPLSYGGNKNSPKPLPANVTCETPLFETDDFGESRRDLLKLFDGDFFYYWGEFVSRRAFLTREQFFSWLRASLLAKQLKAHPFFERVIANGADKSVLYFYWGKGSCEVLPLLDGSRFKKTVVRMHGYDLFEDRSNWYIPYRKQLLESATYVTPTSEAGYNHLVDLYPQFRSKIRVMRCGTRSAGLSPPSNDSVFRIITCSLLVPLKRIHLVVQALQKLQFPVEWTHIGSGPLMDEIKAQTTTLPKNVKANLTGQIDSRNVTAHYINNPCDVFVNVSSTEGAPFSIMEALSAGIPVIATDVGGTAEFVDDTVGRMLPADLSPELLANTLESFYHLSENDKLEIRREAFQRYLEKCDAVKLATEMAELLSQ